MVASYRYLRWLCYALVVLVIISAVVGLGFAIGLIYPDVGEIDDFVNRLEAFRASDRQVFAFVLIGSLSSLAVFLIAAMLGVALRAWARVSPARDAMTLVFVIGGIIGIGAQLLNVAVGQAATFGYCDCGYRAEELIAQDYALSLGWTVVNWLGLGAITLVGVGAAIAGRVVDVSPTWTTLSYVIAVALLFAVSLRVLETFVSIQAFSLSQIADVVVAAVSGILVPIWTILLARGARSAAVETEMGTA